MQTCGWDGCPACGPKIAAERAADIAAGITAHYASGGSVALLTLTLRHGVAQRLSMLLDAATSAWGAIRQDKSVRAGLDRLTVGWIKSNDLTVGRNGWHPHPHVLLFFRPEATEADVHDLAQAMFKVWARRLVRLGLSAPIKGKGGLDVKVLDLTAAHAEVAKYVTATEYAAHRPAEMSAALEVANGNAKKARRGNRTPMQLLAACVAHGRAADRALWAEYETATKTRHRIRWSDGLRSLLIPELGPARTDEEAAASDDGMGRLLALLDRDTYRRVRDTVGPDRLMEWAEIHDDDDQARDVVAKFLALHGCGPLLHPDSLGLHEGIATGRELAPPDDPTPEPRSTITPRPRGSAYLPEPIRRHLEGTP